MAVLEGIEDSPSKKPEGFFSCSRFYNLSHAGADPLFSGWANPGLLRAPFTLFSGPGGNNSGKWGNNPGKIAVFTPEP
jgi:hypothetical protein